MSLKPAGILILGNLKYDTHLVDVTVQLALLPGVNTVRATLPAGVRLDAKPDDEASLQLDGGEGSEKVLTGKLRSLRRGFQQVEAVLSDGGADLSELRPRNTYRQKNGKDVIRALASDAGAGTGPLDIDLPLPVYAASQSRTAAEHIAYLAELGGAIAFMDADGALNVPLRPGSQADAALKYGREFIAYESFESSPPKAKRVAIGSGPAGSPDAPNAMGNSSDKLPGDAPDAGPQAFWRAEPLLRTPAAAKTATDAANVSAVAAATTLRAQCFLLPKLRPGMVIEVQDLPDGPNAGPWLLTRVTHRMQPGLGGQTILEGVSAGAAEGGAGGLLAAIGAAVGGLL
jgi:hypothetical protein